MKLRARLVLGVLGTALPLSLGLAFVQASIERTRALERTAEVTRARMSGDLRARCEETPERFPNLPPVYDDALLLDDALGLLEVATRAPTQRGRARGEVTARMFAYDAALSSENPTAPAIPEEARRALARGEEVVVIGLARRRGAIDERALVRMPWDEGPCARVLVEHRAPPAKLVPRVLVPLVVALGVVVSILIVAGPIVRRLRRLTQLVAEGESSRELDEKADELGELARAFATREGRIASQLEEIRGREEALRRYIANTTHDVLAPVAVLQGHLVTIEGLAREGAPVPRALAVSALEETHYLTGLVHNLNAQARLDAGMVVGEEPVDLSALVARAVSRQTPLAKRQGISVDFATPEAPVHVRGDVTLLEQALSNLVGNAVRYNHEGGHVAVVLEAGARDFTLSVLDDGPGVPEEALAKLGERGFRTNEARTRRPEGMGLGLHIVREVVAAHGMRVGFAANEPRGLIVRLEGERAEMVP